MVLHKSFMANCFFLAVLFPYVSPFRVPFDVQPYALILALIILFMGAFSERLQLPLRLWLLSVPMLYSFSLFIYYGIPNADGLRALGSYISIFAIAGASYHYARYLRIKLFIAAVYIWLAVGLIQFFLYKDFGSWILPRFQPVTYYRGVTSLATEPSHYSGACFFFLLFNEMFYSYGLYSNKQYRRIMVLLIAQMIISFSGFGLLLSFAFISLKLFIRFMSQRSIKSFIKVVGTAVLIFTVTVVALKSEFLSTTRGVSFVNTLVHDRESLMSEPGVVSRWLDLSLPFYGVYRTYGIGFGLGARDANYDNLLSGSDDLVILPTPGVARFQTGWGTAFFELGIFGFILIILVSSVFVRGILRDRGRQGLYSLILISVHAVMFNAVPLAFAPFSFLVGICAAFLWKRLGEWPRGIATGGRKISGASPLPKG